MHSQPSYFDKIAFFDADILISAPMDGIFEDVATEHHGVTSQKAHLKEAAQEPIVSRFMPEVLRKLVNPRPAHHESVRTDATYDWLMFDLAFEEADKVWESPNGHNDEKSKETN